MRPSKGFTIRVFAYSAALLYLAADLFWFDGPVSRRIRPVKPDSAEAVANARANGVAALVFGKPIYLTQVERATREQLWLQGKSIADLAPGQRREARLAALNDLIDHELLRTKVQANHSELPVSEAEIDDAIRRLAARFASRGEMQAELEAEGIDSENELRLRLGARLQQLKYIESRIAGDIAVSEEEAREWFDANADTFKLPLRVRARHIFLSTLGVEADAVKKRLETEIAAIKVGGKTFEAVAAAISDDPRSKTAGGDLGWMTADRLPPDFAAPVFRMETGKPELVRTKLGWHYVEVTDRKPAETRSFDDARTEVIAAIESAKLAERVRALRDAIRKTEAIAIHVYPDVIPAE
jgi:parvulin-like peptidyl-prolyl isomerase